MNNVFLNYYIENEKVIEGKMDTHHCCFKVYADEYIYTSTWAKAIFPSCLYTLSEAWSGVNWGDLMAAQSAFGTDFYDRSTRTIVGTMHWTEYRPVIKIGTKGVLGSHKIRPIHSALSLGQSIRLKVAFFDI